MENLHFKAQDFKVLLEVDKIKVLINFSFDSWVYFFIATIELTLELAKIAARGCYFIKLVSISFTNYLTI